MELLKGFNSKKVLIMLIVDEDIEILNSPNNEEFILGTEEREYFVRKSKSSEFFNFYHPSGVYRCISNGTQIICMEITDILYKNEEDRKTIKKLEENYKNMLNFSDLAVHDVKNYVLILEGFLDLMKEGDVSEETINEMEKAVFKIKDLVLKTSILIRDKSKIRREEVNLSSIISDVISRLKVKIDKKGIVVHQNCKVDIIHTNTILEEAIHNLVDNAIEYTPEGGEITVECVPMGNKIKIMVRDSGPGVPDAVKDVIFERFRTTSGVGMGLGLAVSKHVAELLGGTIRVEDNKPKGAVFIIEIPRK